MRYRTVPLQQIPEQQTSVAQGISSEGVVVGFAGGKGFIEGRALEMPEEEVQFHSVSSAGSFLGGALKKVSGWQAVVVDVQRGDWQTLKEALRVLGVNESGHAVGVAAGPDSHTRGFSYVEGRLEVLEECRRLTALNDAGEAVGFDLESQPLFRYGDGQLERLPRLEGTGQGLAFGLSPDGNWVAGACGEGPDWTATLWNRSDGWKARSLSSGAALDVSNRGLAVGVGFARAPLGYDPLTPWAFMARGSAQGMLWGPGEQVALPGLRAAVALNERGEVAGWGAHEQSPSLKKAMLLVPDRSELNYSLRRGQPEDLPALLELLPSLAGFELPARRRPEHLWQGDGELLKRWGEGLAENCVVHLAEDAQEQLLGFALTSLRPEMLSGAPSAHLEVLVVAEEQRRRGLGQALVGLVEEHCREQGATTLTLHVFANNTRARGLYEKVGFESELLRYIKDL